MVGSVNWSFQNSQTKQNHLNVSRIKISFFQLILVHLQKHIWQVEQKPGGRGRGREWATLGVHPLSWLLSNNRLEKVPFVSVPHNTSSNWLLLSNQDKGCTPSVAHSLALPIGPTLLNLWIISKHFGERRRGFAETAVGRMWEKGSNRMNNRENEWKEEEK